MKLNWRPVLKRVDSIGFGLVLAYFALAAVILWLYFVAGAQRSEHVSRNAQHLADIAQLRAERVANANSRYNDCLRSIPLLMKFDRFMRGVQNEHRGLYQAAVDALTSTSPSDPLYATRVRNVRRARQALDDVLAIKKFPVPTKADCMAIRAKALLSG